MISALHSKQSPSNGGIHVIQAYEYPTASARLAASGFSSEDIGKIARQLDNNSFWILTGVNPTVWSPILTGISISHGDLSNLDNDDHTQYLLVSGTRPMSGDLNLGSNNIINVGQINGINLSAHANRHLPGGADALSTAAPSAIGVGTTSLEGTSTSLARADHIHQSNTPPVDVTKSAAQIGTSGEPARADHKHNIATAAPTVGIGAGNSEGTSTSLARADHNHAIRESGGQDLTMGAIADGQMLVRIGTAIVGRVAATAVSLTHKNAVRVATTSPGTLASSFASGQVVDGVTLATGDRILIKNQTTATENGIYIVNSSGAPTRASDLPASSAAGGIFVFVQEGTTNADTGWLCTSNNPNAAVGTNDLFFAKRAFPLTDSAPVAVTKAAAAVGTSEEAARADHKHDISTAAPAIGIGGGNSEGTSTSLARSDHNHALRETGGPTDLTIGAIPNNTFLLRSGTSITGTSLGIQTTAAGTITTTSTTDVVVTGMTLTPDAGTYVVLFCTDLQHSANNVNIFTTVYANGTAVPHSERVFTRAAASRFAAVNIATVTVAAGQAIDIRWRTASGTATMGNRSLTLIRVG